jgi:hypothetical protein
MHAERLIIETDHSGSPKEFPKLPPNKQLEIIFRVLDDNIPGERLRTPHRDIAGKVRIIGDIINTVPEIDWDLPG